MGTELKLYEIAQQYHELETLSDPDLPEEVVRDTLESLGGELKDKAIGIAQFIRNIEASAETIDAAAEAMHMRAVRQKNLADRIKAYLLANMQLTGITKVECPYFTISIHKNPESVNFAQDAVIPEKFMVIPEPPPPRPDKAKIKAALKAGETVDGCWLSQGEHLRIRV